MRLFTDQALSVGAFVELDAGHAHRLLKVMRARVGDAVTAFNGTGGEYQAEIISLSKKSASLNIRQFLDVDRESPLHVTLIQGISRGNRMDYTIQKSVELGVSSIIPLETTRSMVKLDDQRKANRHEHWLGVIHHACEQSGRTQVPRLEDPMALKDIANLGNFDQGFFLDTQSEQPLAETHRPDGPCYLIAGPEGGFTDDEREWIKSCGIHPIKLGPRILRTETAALAALSIMQQLWGDLST
ncbi:MAG: 16S rRNA (uracil(1498)-N(3))-methyltransferase [Gammaproteobacteria bacterium]